MMQPHGLGERVDQVAGRGDWDHPLDGAVLTKINQPHKNVALDDKIFISDMVYTVDP